LPSLEKGVVIFAFIPKNGGDMNYQPTKTKNVFLYKGTNRNMRCRRKQYEIGKTYTYKRKVRICDTGFHACRDLEDVFFYYPTAKKSRYFVVSTPEIVDESSDKVVCKEITFVRELTVQEIQDVLVSNYLENKAISPSLNIYYLAKYYGADIEFLQNMILNTINVSKPHLLYLFAKNIKGVNIKLLQEHILKCDRSRYLYLFARDICNNKDLPLFAEAFRLFNIDNKYSDLFWEMYSKRGLK
jgi:hypothetical protein